MKQHHLNEIQVHQNFYEFHLLQIVSISISTYRPRRDQVFRKLVFFWGHLTNELSVKHSSSCLYILRLVPNTCGFSVTSGSKIFIDSLWDIHDHEYGYELHSLGICLSLRGQHIMLLIFTFMLLIFTFMLCFTAYEMVKLGFWNYLIMLSLCFYSPAIAHKWASSPVM